jgi:hypothetical protein
MSTKTDDRLLGMLDTRAFCLVEPLLGTWSTLRKALRGAQNLSQAGRSPTSIRISECERAQCNPKRPS